MGVMILITTYVMDEAEKCDSLAMMREGKILATGTAGELISLAKTDTIEVIAEANKKAGETILESQNQSEQILTETQQKAYAREHNIDVDDKLTKQVIVNKINSEMK